MEDNGSLQISGVVHASARAGIVLLLCSIWLTSGIFLDFWAHSNPQLSKLESFFTPWHAVLYSGYLSCAVWMTAMIIANKEPGRSIRSAIPYGYGAGAVGMLVFLLGGLGDMTWHLLFGIEESTEALLSPTHLLLLSGISLILTSPFRALYLSIDPKDDRPTLIRFLPGLLGLSFTTCICAFFLEYVWAIQKMVASVGMNTRLQREFAGKYYEGIINLNIDKGLANVLLTTMIFMVPVMLVLRRWRPPFGSFTLLFGLVALLMLVPFDFRNAAYSAPVVLSGLIADLLVRWLQLVPNPASNGRLRLFAVLVPLAMWSGYYGIMEAKGGIAWSVHLWTGSIAISCMASLLLSMLAFPMADHSRHTV